MRVIPVVDLKHGEVVQGVGGRRDAYRRVQTVLTHDVAPRGMARAFAERFAVADVYVADLDAIAGSEPNWAAFADVGSSGLRLWVDAGVGDVERAVRVAAFDEAPVEAVIVGLESLSSLDELRRITEAVGAGRLAFSLDLKEGQPIARFAPWRAAPPEQIVEAVVAVGVRRMIVLDLAYVGMDRGVACAEVCRRLHRRFAPVELIGGGGVRSLGHARTLAEAGCQGVLLASALHQGLLGREEVAIVQALGRVAE